MERKQKEFCLPGDYRHIVSYPSNMSWQHHVYDDYTLPLTLSDFDKVKRKIEIDAKDTGKLSAVVLEMSLKTSNYATMALRELLKIGTSARHQTSLNTT